MAYELPFMKQIQRQARPRVVFSRLSPGHNMGVAPNMGAGSASNQAVKSLGMKPISKMSRGGHYDEGGLADLAGVSSGAPDFGSYASGLSDSGMSAPPDLGIASGADPASAQGLSDMLSNQSMSNAASDMGSADMGNILPNQLMSRAASTPGFSTPKTQGGFMGWLNNQHGGATGGNWLKAGLSALTGVLGGLQSNSGIHPIDMGPNSRFNRGNGGIGVRPVGRHAQGGIMSYAQGGQVCMADGGQVKPSPSMLDEVRSFIHSLWPGQLADAAQAIQQQQQPSDGMVRQAPLNAQAPMVAQAPLNAQPPMRAQAPLVYHAAGGPVGQPMPAGQPQPQGQAQAAPGSPEQAQNQQITMEAAKALMGQSSDPQAAIQAFLQHFGQAALQELQQKVQQAMQQKGGQQGAPQDQGQPQQPQTPAMAGGGSVSGPGDGMSDNVPFQTSNGGQALLSNDEYVIPADAVSQLGNGSSSAGARKLDAGIASLRQGKYGHSKQPKKLSPGANPILSGKKKLS